MTPPQLPKDAATEGEGKGRAAATARAREKQERLARAYDSEVAPVYAQRFCDMILDALTPRPAARVVEVGCATGGLTLELARRFDDRTRITAVDEAPFVAQARTKLAGQAVGRITFELGPAAPLALPDASADVVVSNLAAAAFSDPARAARELARVLAPGRRRPRDGPSAARGPSSSISTATCCSRTARPTASRRSISTRRRCRTEGRRPPGWKPPASSTSG